MFFPIVRHPLLHIPQYHAGIPHLYAGWSFISCRVPCVHLEAVREDVHAQVKMYLSIENSAIDSGSCPINDFLYELNDTSPKYSLSLYWLLVHPILHRYV